MKEPVDHILRPSLPWRRDTAAVTECGYDATKVKTLTRQEYFHRLKDLGSQRAAMITCMTCAQTAGRYATWEDDPLGALMREIDWEHGPYRIREGRGHRLLDEILAIASLVETHRDEFEGLIEAGERRRDWLEKKAALRPKDTRNAG